MNQNEEHMGTLEIWKDDRPHIDEGYWRKRFIFPNGKIDELANLHTILPVGKYKIIRTD